MKKVITALLAATLLASPASAGSISFTPGSGDATGAGTDGTSKIPGVLICGATSSATLYAQCVNQVFVNASGQMGITGPVTNAGTFAVQASESGTWTVQPGNTANTTAWLTTGAGGTFPATESGTWTVQPGNTANTTAWLTTGTGGVFPSSQSGAWTVQPGNTANTTAWLFNLGSVGGTALNAATSAYGTAPTGTTVMGVNAFVTNTNPNVGNNADAIVAGASAGSPVIDYLFGFNGATWDRLQVDASKFLKVDCAAGCSSSTSITSWGGGTLGAMANYGTSPGAVLVPGENAFVTNTVTVTATNLSMNEAQVNGVTTSTGTGAVGTGSQRVAVGTDTATIAGSSPTGVLSLAANQSVNLAQVGGSTSGVVAASVTPVTATNVAQVVDLRPDSPGIIPLGANTAANSVPMVPPTDKVQGTPSTAVVGSYCMSSASGTMAAGLAANSPVFSLRYGGSGIALVRRVRFTANDSTTGFTAGNVQIQLFAARSYSVNDTGGTVSTLTGNNGKLRTSFATTALSDFRTSSTATLTAGTRTLDATPLGTWVTSVPATAETPIMGPTPIELVRPEAGEQPEQLANNEGLVIQATVPATGTWVFAVQVCWDEVTAY